VFGSRRRPVVGVLKQQHASASKFPLFCHTRPANPFPKHYRGPRSSVQTKACSLFAVKGCPFQ